MGYVVTKALSAARPKRPLNAGDHRPGTRCQGAQKVKKAKEDATLAVFGAMSRSRYLGSVLEKPGFG